MRSFDGFAHHIRHMLPRRPAEEVQSYPGAFAHVFKYARLFEVWVTTYNQGECMRFQQHFGSGGSLLCHL